MTKVIKGNLVLTEDTTFNESLTVEGNITGYYNLTVKGDLNCMDLNCWDLNCRDLNCWDLNCRNVNCWDLNCRNVACLNLNCHNLNCFDLDFYGVAIAYKSFKCKNWKARRKNYIIKCLDGEIEVKRKVCDKCGQELLT